MEKAREFQKNIYFCFIDCAKVCVVHKLWKVLKKKGVCKAETTPWEQPTGP